MGTARQLDMNMPSRPDLTRRLVARRDSRAGRPRSCPAGDGPEPGLVGARPRVGPDYGCPGAGPDARRRDRSGGSPQRTDRHRAVRRGQGRRRRAARPQRAAAPAERRGLLRPHAPVRILRAVLRRLRRLRGRRVRRRRLLRAALRATQCVPVEPRLLAGGLCRRPHRRPAASGSRRAHRRRPFADVGPRPAGARCDAGLLRRRADRPARGHRRGLARTGGGDRRPGGAVVQGRPRARVRVAPRPRRARQPAPERDSREGESHVRVPPPQAAARDPVAAGV